MSHTITITGATGNVGKTIAEILLEKGVKVRTIARNTEKLAALKAKGAETFPGELENTSFLIETFRGSDSVFVMTPPCYHLSNFQEVLRQMSASLTEAIKTTGISHTVALSSIGADLPSGNGQIASLFEFESMLKAVPELSVIALRSAFFMENHLGSIQLIKNARINGSIINADSPISMIATRDIAAIASGYLLDPKFSGYNVHYLLGPRDYTFKAATAILGKAIGKPDLMYVKFPEDEFIKGLISAGFSENAAYALREGFTALGEGQLTKNVERNVINTTPTSLEEFAKEVFAPAYNS